ncbi:MAG: hypothetical protein IJZ44_08295 [Lachnospiraceae bacterium]|nr:hypothetical protein [Lachnospiraceae bacterium]
MKKLVVILMAALLLCGCKKEDEQVFDPNMPQPILGEDAEGYGGFTYLQSYAFGEEGGNSVLYLPKDAAAYVGETCMICKTEGVEVTLNYNPLYSDEIKGKSLKHKLDYTMGIEYSDIYAEEYKSLKISDITTVEDYAVLADASYLVLDKEQQNFVAYWVQYYLVELEDGREFRTAIKVSSDQETANTEAVLEELEKYFAIDLSYESGMLQSLIDGYDPTEEELARMDGTIVEMGALEFVLPKFWIRSEIAEDIAKTSLISSEYDAVEVYAEVSDAKSMDFNTYIVVAQMPSNISSGEFGTLDKGEIELLERLYEELFLQQYPGMSVETDAYASDLGFVIEVDMSGLDGLDGLTCVIARGDKMYVVMGTCIESNEADAKEIRKIMKEVIANTQVAK